jgi:hypothetical protein
VLLKEHSQGLAAANVSIAVGSCGVVLGVIHCCSPSPLEDRNS